MRSDHYFLSLRMVAALLLVSLSISMPVRAQDPFQQPGGIDPFGGKATGTPASADPFEEEPVTEQERARRVDEAIVKAEQICARALSSNRSPAEHFNAALCRLEFAMRSSGNPLLSPQVIPSLEALARLRPNPWEGGSIQDLVVRLSREARESRSFLAWEISAHASAYRELTSEPWPMDWRRVEEFWLKLVETMLITRAGESSESNWRRLIETFPGQAMLCRLAYLVAIRNGPGNGTVDRQLVQPLIEESKSSVRTTVLMDAELLATLLETRTDLDDPFYRQVRDELLGLLTENDSAREILGAPGVMESLAKTYQSAYRQPSERHRLLATLLVHSPPDAFQHFAEQARFPRSRLRQLRLAKPIAIDANDESLVRVLERLRCDAALSLWIDDSLGDDRSRVALGHLAGPWFEVLEQVVAGSPCRLELLGEDVLWVGKPEQLAAAYAAYQYGIGQAQAADSRTGDSLIRQTGAEFIACPVRDVAQFLRDKHDVMIELLASGDTLISLDIRGLPLHLGLTKLAASISGRWCVSGSLIVIGTDADMARIRRIERNRLRRWARLGLMDTNVTEALRDDTRLEFMFTPVKQVAEFLSDQHGIAVRASPAVAEVEFTEDVKSITLEEALDFYFGLKHGIAWHTDGQTIFLGTGD